MCLRIPFAKSCPCCCRFDLDSRSVIGRLTSLPVVLRPILTVTMSQRNSASRALPYAVAESVVRALQHLHVPLPPAAAASQASGAGHSAGTAGNAVVAHQCDVGFQHCQIFSTVVNVHVHNPVAADHIDYYKGCKVVGDTVQIPMPSPPGGGSDGHDGHGPGGRDGHDGNGDGPGSGSDGHCTNDRSAPKPGGDRVDADENRPVPGPTPTPAENALLVDVAHADAISDHGMPTMDTVENVEEPCEEAEPHVRVIRRRGHEGGEVAGRKRQRAQ